MITYSANRSCVRTERGQVGPWLPRPLSVPQLASLHSPCPSNAPGFIEFLMCKMFNSSCLPCPGWPWRVDRGGCSLSTDGVAAGRGGSAACRMAVCVFVSPNEVKPRKQDSTLCPPPPCHHVLPVTVSPPSLQQPLSVSQVLSHKTQVTREGD